MAGVEFIPKIPVFKQSTTTWAIVTGKQSVCVLLTVNVTTSSAGDQLMQICMDLFIAGAIPIGATLDFLVLMMLLHPEVQQKAQKEIDSVVGRNRLPQLSDKPKYVCTTVEVNFISFIN
jgi:hypothetical protein